MCDTSSSATNVLSNCSYKNVNEIVNVDKSCATLYFKNIDGYKSNFEETMYNTNSFRSSPSFIAFYETNFRESDINYYEISGYNSENLHGMNNKSKGSGIPLYFKKSLLFNRIASLNICNEHFECMGGRFNTHSNQFYIIVVYRFHYKDNEFINEFNKALNYYKNKPLIVMGDFNINLLNYDSNKTDDDFENDTFPSSLYPLVNKPTNFFQNNSSLINQAWSNMLYENTNCSILNVSVSNHKPLLITMPVSLKHFTENDEQTINMRINNITETTIEKFSDGFNEFMDSIKHDLNNITDKDCLSNVFRIFIVTFPISITQI